jgi:hypothetical protein
MRRVSDCMRIPCSPANAEAAQLYRENMKEYVRRVKVSCMFGMVVELRFVQPTPLVV